MISEHSERQSMPEAAASSGLGDSQSATHTALAPTTAHPSVGLASTMTRHLRQFHLGAFFPDALKSVVNRLRGITTLSITHMLRRLNRAKPPSAFPKPLVLMGCIYGLPNASAWPLPAHQSPAKESRSAYSDASIGDFIISGGVLVYLVLALCFHSKAKGLSLLVSVTSAVFWVAMVSEGDHPEFPSNYRWTVLKIWAATTVALASQSVKYLTETTNDAMLGHMRPSLSRRESTTYRFLFQLFGLSTLIQVTGMAIQSFKKGSFLRAFPPCVSIAVLITFRINQNPAWRPRASISQSLESADSSLDQANTMVSPDGSLPASSSSENAILTPPATGQSDTANPRTGPP